MSVRIVIKCDDYWVADSLNCLASEIENTDILEPVYNEGKKATDKGDHYNAKIEYVK
jgi:hypothetical protein